METHPLEGRRAMVTGASRGIGRQIALSLAEAGADVALTARTRQDLENVAEEVEQRGRESLVVPCDITRPDRVGELAQSVKQQMGNIHILVNNAGAAESHPFRDHPDELWHRMIDLNLNGPFYVTRAFLDQLLENGWGRIVNNASIVARTSSRYIAAYTASKHGVLGLTRALARELVEDNITVNAVCPGYVDTPMTDRNVENIMQKTGMSEGEVREYLAGKSPQNRLMTPEEVAAVAVFLCREESRGINGQAINVDGGEILG